MLSVALSLPSSSHATQSMVPKPAFQNLKWFGVTYKTSSLQLYVKWKKYTQRNILGRTPRKAFSYKVVAGKVLQGKQGSFCFQFPYSYEARALTQGLCKALLPAAGLLTEKERLEASGMDFVPETIVRVAFCLPILLHACSSIWTLASQMQPEYKKKKFQLGEKNNNNTDKRQL